MCTYLTYILSRQSLQLTQTMTSYVCLYSKYGYSTQGGGHNSLFPFRPCEIGFLTLYLYVNPYLPRVYNGNHCVENCTYYTVSWRSPDTEVWPSPYTVVSNS